MLPLTPDYLHTLIFNMYHFQLPFTCMNLITYIETELDQKDDNTSLTHLSQTLFSLSYTYSCTHPHTNTFIHKLNVL
jgi:hypothetical protein